MAGLAIYQADGKCHLVAHCELCPVCLFYQFKIGLLYHPAAQAFTEPAGVVADQQQVAATTRLLQEGLHPGMRGKSYITVRACSYLLRAQECFSFRRSRRITGCTGKEFQFEGSIRRAVERTLRMVACRRLRTYCC